MPKVERADWYFIAPATIVWSLTLVLTAWDFIYLQGWIYHLNAWSVLGLFLFISGVSLREISKRTLKKNYSYVLTKQQKQLVTNGVYRFIRHPIYLAAILYVLGWPLIFSSLYGFFVALAFIPCILYRIKIEERMLIEEFGEQYVDYMKHTKNLLPYVY